MVIKIIVLRLIDIQNVLASAFRHPQIEDSPKLALDLHVNLVFVFFGVVDWWENQALNDWIGDVVGQVPEIMFSSVFHISL